MKLKVKHMALWSFLAAGCASADVPPNHPAASVLAKFSPHFRCPYANEWVAKGPQQAALDLGLLNSTKRNVNGSSQRGSLRRRTQQTIAGSCSYTNTWTGQPSCLEMRGGDWTAENMATRCGEETDGVLSSGLGCQVAPGLAGWCILGEGESIEATPMPLSAGMDCGQVQMACENFVQGTFETDEGCTLGAEPAVTTEESGEGSFSFPVGVPSGEPVSCAIAPGAIGAGHQAGYSTGYSPNCEGTPAEGSPYMWPMGWTAHVEAESMAFGSDDVVYHSKGFVYYRLDKNWKRHDWYWQRGTQRGGGQGPCDPENVDEELSEGNIQACRRDSDEYQTMIHRGSKMFFITWKNDTEVGSSDPAQIAECDYIDFQVVGNIRNDWFLDDRGDSTDVQYLGDQHVIYENKPRLVKQWRKQDFANMYFVMSVQAIPKEDGIHWPMVLNVPGEGFGDDFLQVYSNQSLLSDEDDSLFWLDEAFEKLNGTCNKMRDGGVGGPPDGGRVEIPSNLEVDPNSWFSNVYTYSPVWKPPIANDTDPVDEGSTGVATTQHGDVVVDSCYDPAASAVQLSFSFNDIEMLPGGQMPWMAIGYRETEECLMNPRDGGDTNIILVAEQDGDVQANLGLLPRAARSYNGEAISSIYEGLTPLADKAGFSSVDLHLPTTSNTALAKSAHTGPEDTVQLHFQQTMAEAPEVMHLMYAVGTTAEMGYHRTRKCFSIEEFPICPTQSDPSQAGVSKEEPETDMNSVESSAATVSMLSAAFVGVLAALS